MIITGITACDHRAYLENMQQRVPSLRYTMQTTQTWTPNSVIGKGCDAPAMCSNDGRHVDCCWSPLSGLDASRSDRKDRDAVAAVVPFTTVRMKHGCSSGSYLFADLKPEVLGSVHLIAGYLKPLVGDGMSQGFFPHVVGPQPGRTSWIDREPLILNFAQMRGWLIGDGDALPAPANSKFLEVSVSPAMR